MPLETHFPRNQNKNIPLVFHEPVKHSFNRCLPIKRYPPSKTQVSREKVSEKTKLIERNEFPRLFDKLKGKKFHSLSFSLRCELPKNP